MLKLLILCGSMLGAFVMANQASATVYDQVKSNVTSIAQCVLGKVDEKGMTYITNVVIDDVVEDNKTLTVKGTMYRNDTNYSSSDKAAIGFALLAALGGAKSDDTRATTDLFISMVNKLRMSKEWSYTVTMGLVLDSVTTKKVVVEGNEFSACRL